MTALIWLFTGIATISYAIIYQVPIRALLGCGIIGLGAGFTLAELSALGIHRAGATLVAALMVALFSQWLATWQKVPATVFALAGIIPLVPGYRAYTAVTHMMNQEVLLGLEKGIETLFIALAIAAGLVIGESMVRVIKGRRSV